MDCLMTAISRPAETAAATTNSRPVSDSSGLSLWLVSSFAHVAGQDMLSRLSSRFAASAGKSRPGGLLPSGSKSKPNLLLLTPPTASICHKDHIDPEIMENKPKPWPYDRKRFTWSHLNLFRTDRCIQRFDENTVVICIEGPMAAGKHDFGLALSKELGMRYYGEADTEPMMIWDDGFDRRTLNWLLPESAQYADMKMMYLNPLHRGVPGFFMDMYMMKYFHYVEGLTHLYNTGQGVIHERSPFSDWIFLEAQLKLGFQKSDTKEHYHDVYMDTHQMIHRPHLVIYLDVPAEIAFKRFYDKSPEYIRKSPVMTIEYFKILEDLYRNRYLPMISKHAEVLVYDWTVPGHTDLVIEDIENIDFLKHDLVTEKLEDWRYYRDEDFDEDRLLYSCAREYMYCFFSQPDYDKPSVLMSQVAAKYREEIEKFYCPKWEHGFDPKLVPWWKIMWKPELPHYRLKSEYEYFSTSLRDKWTQLQCF